MWRYGCPSRYRHGAVSWTVRHGEGIETSEQARLLREWSCQTGQGYLFSRPLPADEFTALLRARSTGSSRR